MIDAKLNTIEDLETLPVKITYVGERTGEWSATQTVDEWRVTIASGKEVSDFEYFTGLGRRTRKYSPTGEKWDKAEKKYFNTRPTPPKIADVLSCLVSDANAVNENFSSWCYTYGYSSDSITAFNTYQACLKTGESLRKHCTREMLNKIGELLQDY